MVLVSDVNNGSEGGGGYRGSGDGDDCGCGGVLAAKLVVTRWLGRREVWQGGSSSSSSVVCGGE